MMQDIEERRSKALEFLQRLYEKTVGENDRTKYVDIAEVSHEMERLPPPSTDELSKEEKDELYEQGKEAKEVVLRLKEQGLVNLVGHPNPYYGGQVYITQRGVDVVENTIIKGQLSDNELRGVVLQKLYEERDRDYIPVKEKFFGSAISQPTLFRISEQLEQHGLISLEVLTGDDQIQSAMGKITAQGVDVVEGQGQSAPIQITFIGTQIIQGRGRELEEQMLTILSLLREESDTEESLAEKANEIIQLQPNFMGLGVNVNEIIRRVMKKRGGH